MMNERNLTDLEREALKLLINSHGELIPVALADLCHKKALELNDDRPVDVQRRKAELNDFLNFQP